MGITLVSYGVGGRGRGRPQQPQHRGHGTSVLARSAPALVASARGCRRGAFRVIQDEIFWRRGCHSRGRPRVLPPVRRSGATHEPRVRTHVGRVGARCCGRADGRGGVRNCNP
eukprot:Amastigsp_a174667_196.p5 type:complete len:113 gc:universal Amastigsp_a174667_196:1-339(+)